MGEKKPKAAFGRAAEEPAADRPRGHHRRLCVLLVDDNQDHTLLVRRALEQRGHSIATALSGEEAMATLVAGEFDAVALDYHLPDSTGLQVLQEIMHHSQGLPVVMVTASGNEQVAVTALKSGASDYVVKNPGYERELARALELAAEAARARAAEAALRAELEVRAVTDPLTSLLNRGEMERILKREIQRMCRYHRALSFALMDVDDFKKINDTLGHLAGDAVLCHIAQTLQTALRISDSAARWGGDEFAVLLPDTDFGGTKAFAERLRRLLQAAPVAWSEGAIPPISLSMGFVLVEDMNLDLFVLLKWADRALYAAKAAGRDRARFFALGDGKGEGPAAELPSPLVLSGEKGRNDKTD